MFSSILSITSCGSIEETSLITISSFNPSPSKGCEQYQPHLLQVKCSETFN